MRENLYEICRKVVGFEDAFIDLAFEINSSIEGLSSSDVKQYIRYIADRRLAQLGLNEIYMIAKNPLPWMDFILNGMEHTNFFDNKSTEYTRSATTGSWSEAFAIHDNAVSDLFKEKEDISTIKD